MNGRTRLAPPQRGRRVLAVVMAFVACVFVSSTSRAQMPDLAQMSGAPLPAGDLPTGTLSVRVVRGELTNNVAGVDITVHDGTRTLSGRTDETGRATFSGIAPGASVHAHATVDGKELQSQTFPMPAAGGVKMMFVAGAATQAPAGGEGMPMATGPAKPGTVVIGGQSRIVLEPTDEGLDVYLLFDVANTETSPVTTEPIVFAVPDKAQALTVLENSSQQVKAEGRQFVLTGPFAPGLTPVQMAYRIEHGTGSLHFAQPLPLAMPTTSVLVRKVDGLEFRSPQAGSAREVTMQDGSLFVMATGQALEAGKSVEFALEGLPHHSRLPMFVALGLAIFIAGFGVWMAVEGPARGSVSVDARRKVEEKRDSLLDQLVHVEQQRRAPGGDTPKAAARREELIAQLERVYAQLDHQQNGSAMAAHSETDSSSSVRSAGVPVAR